MKTPRTRIARFLADSTLAGVATPQLSQQIAAYLLSERRVNELDSLLRDVQADWAAAGHVEVIASSAHPLTAATKADITRQMQQLYPKATQITVTETHDPKVIGGVRLSLADKQVDATVSAKLNKFKQLTAA